MLLVPIFTEDETEAQRSRGISLRSHRTASLRIPSQTSLSLKPGSTLCLFAAPESSDLVQEEISTVDSVFYCARFLPPLLPLRLGS